MKSLISLIFCLLILSSCQQTVVNTEVKTFSFKADFQPAWEHSRAYTLALADSMPAELYDYKPKEEVFTFGRQFTHCIDFAAGQLMGNGLIESAPFQQPNWDNYDKAQIKAALNGMYDFIDSLAQNLPDSTLQQDIELFGKPTQAWRVFHAIENHTIHHRGQALIYMRLNDITPPGYAGW